MNFYKLYKMLLMGCCVLFSQLSFAKSDVTITVWVHGTYPVLTALASKHSPFRSWIYVEPGISLAKNLPYDYYFNQLAHECHKRNPEAYNKNHFYTYGWYSSKVRPAHRRMEGQKLFDAITELLKEYKTKYDTITLRLVGVSHGGNVVLHCVRCMPFLLDGVDTEIVLLATPIQESTRDYVNNPCLKKVYSFYSDVDWIQRIDMQKCHSDAPKKCPVWSKRTFKNSDRVIQIRLKINGQFIGHARYRSIVKYLPEMLRAVDDYVGQDESKASVMLNFKVH